MIYLSVIYIVKVIKLLLLFTVFIVFLHLFPYSRYIISSLHETLAIIVTSKMEGVWFHIVLNFFGFNDDKVFTVYHDGVQFNNTANRIKGTLRSSDRRIILGRSVDEIPSSILNPTRFYSSLSIDELRFHNHILTDKEIMQMIQ